MKKPNFFIIGAPKCGTTSLVEWLAGHPNIYFSPIKEPHFFNRDGMYLTDTLEEYESLFASARAEHLAVGEASTHYLYSQLAVPRIIEYNPDTKFIVCIRNPIEMAPSLHSERVWQGVETVKDFGKAWRLQPLRKQGKYIPRTILRDPERLQYGAYCRLGEQIKRLYSRVPKDRVLILVLDDIAANPLCEYQKTLQFLGVSEDKSVPEFIVYNQRKAVRWPSISYILRYVSQIRRSLGFRKPIRLYSRIQYRFNTTKQKGYDLPSDLRAELVEYFKNDIHVLERILNRDFSYWIKLNFFDSNASV